MTAALSRILVVDDDVQIRRALLSALSARSYDVVLAGSGEEALALASVNPPDMVILDLSLPGVSGLEVCQELRNWTQVPILILSVRDRPAEKVAALDLGADDYLIKPFDTGELLARIRSHLRRARNLPSTEPVIEANGLKIDLAGHLVFRNGEEIKLTRTEFALLQYLAQHAGRVVTYSLLLSTVWGHSDAGDTQTLRVHIGHLRRKVEQDPDRPRLILTEPGVGYRFQPGL